LWSPSHDLEIKTFECCWGDLHKRKQLINIRGVAYAPLPIVHLQKNKKIKIYKNLYGALRDYSYYYGDSAG